MRDLLDKLVDETFELSEKLTAQEHARSPFDDWDMASIDEVVTPESSGLLYRVQVHGHSYNIRCLPVDNIQVALKQLQEGDEQIQKSLRIDPAEDTVVHYFETSYRELAEVIADQIGLERFPLNSQGFSSLTDPSPFWEMRMAKNSLQLLTDSKYAHTVSGHWNRLGPLGDGIRAKKYFAELFNTLSLYMPIAEQKISSKEIYLKIEDEQDPLFENLMALLLEGEGPENLYQCLGGTLSRELYFYLNELASLRKFWLDLSSHLSESH